jgi:DNA integrity scanning protein DisA with diadenylate cyclase activity
MTELISMPQANHLMIAVFVIAPIIGLIWGAIAKQLMRGLIVGLAIGGGNMILWIVYNAITDRLGLDTVKNLVVNLVLFIALGIIAGIVIGRFAKHSETVQNSEATE